MCFKISVYLAALFHVGVRCRASLHLYIYIRSRVNLESNGDAVKISATEELLGVTIDSKV